MEQGIRGFLSERKVTALVRAIPAPHWQKGCVELISYYGLGKLQPDTLVLGIPSEKSDQSALAEVLSVAAGHGRNVLLLRLDAVSQDAAKDESDWQIRRLVSRKKATREIFVWWGGKKHNASLMIALGYLLQAAREWDDAGLVFQSVVQHGDHAEEALQRLNDFVVRSRIEARTNVVVTNGEGDILDVIVQESRAAAMTFLGVRAADKEESAADYADYLAKFIEATRPISNLALVMAGDEIRLARLFR